MYRPHGIYNYSGTMMSYISLMSFGTITYKNRNLHAILVIHIQVVIYIQLLCAGYAHTP
jgi:hypothetical protein